MTNKELVTAFFEEGYVNHNYDFLLSHMAPDYYDNSPCAARSNLACVEILKGTEGMFPDMAVEILDLIEEGERVCVRLRFSGTHSAPSFGFPATGKRITFEALEIFRMENCKITESWGYWPDSQIMELLKG